MILDRSRLAAAGHMHDAVLDLSDTANIRNSWTFYENGEPSGVAVMNLKRVAGGK